MSNDSHLKKRRLVAARTIAVLSIMICAYLSPSVGYAGTFTLSPSTGEIFVGKTFEVKILLDTEGKSVNALDVDLRFPPDKMQLVSSETSVSVISLWTTQPKFNNQTGTIRLQGGIPGGISVRGAQVATLMFRAKSSGNAIVRFGDESKILLNNGLATNDLSMRHDSVYKIVLPPPGGPEVISPTHPDQSGWYSNDRPVFEWSTENGVENYSYLFNQNATSDVDDVSEGDRTIISYSDVADGLYYFHIKSLRSGVWGGLTHFQVGIDTDPPAEFPLEILPSTRTKNRTIIAQFATTDTLSGLDRYELKIIPISSTRDVSGANELFIEAQSPYVSSDLAPGRYDLIVRAYDKAGNYRDVIQRFTIVEGLLGFATPEGLQFGPYAIAWGWVIAVLALLIAYLFVFLRQIKKRHAHISDPQDFKNLPDGVRTQLEELKRYKSKYGTIAVLLCVIVSSVWVGHPTTVHAVSSEQAPIIELAPPYVTTVSHDVTNDEIFYIGGKTERKDTLVTIYTQNLTTGETTSYEVVSDVEGEWFYRHGGFLTPGAYILWTQASIEGVKSPPSAQIQMNVARAALTFGVTRISYETLYLVSVGLLLAVVCYLLAHIAYHVYHHKKKQALVVREIRDAEESVKRGFAVLRHDIERELALVRSIGLTRPMDAREKEREDELLRDLKDVEHRISRGIWGIERAENTR